MAKRINSLIKRYSNSYIKGLEEENERKEGVIKSQAAKIRELRAILDTIHRIIEPGDEDD